MSKVFHDSLGHVVPYEENLPITWRLTVYAFAVRDGKILMLQPCGSERWELPGGEVHPHETLLEGLIRECWEETGYQFVPQDILPIHFTEQFFYERELSKYRHAVIVVFAGTITSSGDPDWTNAEANEVKRVEWISPHQLNASNTHPNQLPALIKSGLVTLR